MQPIRILTPQFEWLGEIDDYESLQFIRRHKKSGEFELHINVNKHLTETLQEDCLVYLAENKVGIIKHRELSRDGSETLMIKGPTFKNIMSRRITLPAIGAAYDTVTGNAETVMKHYVYNHAVNPTDISRIIPNLEIATNQQHGASLSKQSRLQQLDEEIESIAELTEIGWEVYVDLERQKFIFDVVEGRNLTVVQSILPPVIFSVDFDNLKNAQFIDSAIGHKNTAYVGGQGEGEARRIIEMGSATGLNRYETFVDARDVDETENVDGKDVPVPETEVVAQLTQRGQEALLEVQKLRTFESEILTYGPFEYESDWDLGDIVTVQDEKWGVTLDTPITEVKEIYEASGFRLEATFGNNVPTLIDKVKQAINSPMVEKAMTITAVSELDNDAGYITLQDVSQAQSYVHTQVASSNMWTVAHNMDKYPSITVTDSADSVMIADVTYQDLNIVIINFGFAVTGKAICN